ncbi:MAG: ABC transporter substrate-binding protein [Chloroflexi bacterium]|nr:ABC transporter substrate-binding protein [Chloroflexota bacterium]
MSGGRTGESGRDTRLGRRRLLGLGALAGGSAAFALACGGGKSRTDTGGTTSGAASPNAGALATQTTGQAVAGAGEKPKRGGTLTLNAGGSPRSLDPHFDTFPAHTIVANNVYNALLAFTNDVTKIEPELATALPEQPDPLSYVFKLRQGVKFQDIAPANGRELTAEDVKYSIERQMTNDPGKFQHAYFFLNKIAKIETPDKYTVKFTTNKPMAPFMSYIASPWTMIILRELVEKEGDLTTKMLGTGPFIFDEWQKDVQFKLHRNPNYWRKDASGEQLPYIDNLVIKIITDANAAQAQFASGAVDADGIQFTFVEEIKKKLPKAKYQIIPSQFPRQFRTSPYDGDKIQHRKPYNDIRVRQALIQAINKKEVLDIVYSGDGVPIKGPILPIYPIWEMKDELVKFDVADSKRLLEAAGYGSGFDAEMIFTNTAGDIPNNIAEVLKAQLGKIGVRVKLAGTDTTTYYNKAYAFDYEIAHHQPLNQPDPDENLASYFGRASTYYKWGNKDIWAAIDKQAELVNVEERKKAVEEAQKMIVLDYPMNFMFTTNLHFFAHPRVKGWFFGNDLYNGRRETAWIDPTA